MIGKILLGIVIVIILVIGGYFIYNIDRTGIMPVSTFDEQRYLGEWNEVARLNHGFEKDCKCATATYTPRDDYIEVYNYCEKENEVSDIKGKAYLTETPGLLKVQFFPLIKSDYKVIYIDEFYQNAIVGGSNMNFLWILSRNTNLQEERLQELVDIAEDLGYDVDKLIFPEICGE
jgi:apolipoprotein D and lipocalin family protein